MYSGLNDYNNYNNYNPYLQQMQMQMNQQMQSMQSMQQRQMQQQTGMDVAYVPDLHSVEQLQLAPGQRKLVLVQNEPVVAMRVADSMGLVSTDYYRLEKFSPTDAIQPKVENDYITKEQLEARLSEMFEQLTAMKKENE